MPLATTEEDDNDENIIIIRSRREQRELREQAQRDRMEDDDDDGGSDNDGTARRQRNRYDDDDDNNRTRRVRYNNNEPRDENSINGGPFLNTPTPTTAPAVVPPPMPTPTRNTFGILSALERAYPAGYSKEMMREEMELQLNVKGETQAIASFRTEMLQQQQLTVFAFVQPKDLTIHLLHSPATYYARGATGPLKGKDIGFVGDRSEFNTPAPVILQPEKPWKWITKQAVQDDVIFNYYYANPANQGKLYTPPPGTALTRTIAPRLLLLPGNLVQYCVEAPRTPWDLHKHVSEIIAAPGPGNFHEHYALVLTWCCLALHSDGADSSLQYDLQAAASTEVFQRWARMRINATLGAPPAHQHAPAQTAPVQDLTQLSAIAAEFGKGVIQALRPATATATMATALGATNTSDGRDYDKYQKALLQGFSHSPTVAGLQPIWELFTQTKNIDIHRMHLREAMNKWATKWGVTITGGVHLSKIAIDDIVNLRFNPGGSVAYYASADKGISILLCRSRPGEEREAARLRELAEEQSSANISLAEALSLLRNTPPTPPDTYIDLKTCVGTFCAMLWALFGDNCEYLMKLHELYTCLNCDRVTECWANFTPLLCRQIIWAIIDDGREYFSQTMLPDKFLVPPGGLIRFPHSCLEELIRPIKRQAPILTATFPQQWVIAPLVANHHSNATPTGARTHIGTVIATTRPTSTTSTQSVTTRATAANSTSSSLTGTTHPATTQQSTIRQTNVHPTIKALLEPFIQRHRQLQLTRIMMVGGVTWPNMPKIDRLVENGINNLCYNFALGKCTSRYCTHRRLGHINADAVPDDFATTLCSLLRPGIETITDAQMNMPWVEFQAAMAARRTQTE